MGWGCLLLGLGGGRFKELLGRGAIALATAAGGLALAATPFGSALEERFGLAWLFSLRGTIEAPDDVVVVGLDRRSAEGLGLSEKIREWPRGLYADVIDRLVARQATAIAIDLIFEQVREPLHDRALIKAIERAERVVLFEKMELQRKPVGHGGNAMLGLLETQRLRPPISAFAEVAAGLGPFPLPLVPDRISQAWLFNPGAGGRPTLPAVAVQLHAIGAYDRWLSLLKRAGAHGLETLPGAAAALESAADLRGVMMAFRNAFLADSDLGERVRAAVDQAQLDAPATRLLHALTDLYAGADSRYLNFYGPAGRIRTLSLVDVVEGRDEPEFWRGRGAFIGQSELYEPHKDAFITVYSRPDGVKIAGVEIAATAFANLLDGTMLDPSPWWLAAIAAFGLVIGVTAAFLPAIWAMPACLLLGILYLAGASSAFAGNAIWLPTAVPLLVELPLGLFLGLMIQYRRARRARENLSRAMRFFLPDRIAEGFADAPATSLVQDEEAYAISLITDAGGFTRIAESMTSKELKAFLEDYLEILFTAVETHGGRVTDSIGDGITASWASPIPDPAIAAKACQAALIIDREVQRFNKRHETRRLPTRIGLNAGWVTIGHVGGAGRFTYTVIGDAVNTASRIEQLNKHLGTRILAAQAVVEAVPDLAVRPLGQFQFVGKKAVLEMVEVMDADASGRQVQLIQRFGKALAVFKQQNWQMAADMFALLAEEFEDGAAHFYLKTCRQYISGSPRHGNGCVIRLETK